MYQTGLTLLSDSDLTPGDNNVCWRIEIQDNSNLALCHAFYVCLTHLFPPSHGLTR